MKEFYNGRTTTYPKAVTTPEDIDRLPFVLLSEFIEHLFVDEHRSSVYQIEIMPNVSFT